jgi:hypothetical protein
MMMLASAILASLLTTSAGAADSNGAKLTVEHAWARASAGTTAAAYFAVNNQGSAADRLLAISTPVAEKAALHESKMENGVMKMREVGPIAIEPGQSVVLKPGADHVMLIGLKHPLKQGESFPLTLSFERAGKVEVAVRVERAGSMGGDAAGHGSMQQMPGSMDHGSMK